MNIVALTAGKPHQRYVIDRLHARLPLRAVFITQERNRAAPPSLKQRYWAARRRWRLTLLGERAESSGERLTDRIARLENRLRRRAWRTQLDAPSSERTLAPPDYEPVDSLNSPVLAERLRALPTDVLLLLGCPMIRKPVLEAARLGALNCHTSLLPDFRGSCPEHWILLTGRHESAGVTIHWATPQLDAGEIAAQRPVAVRPNDNPFTLRMRCMRAAVEAFAEVLQALAAGQRLARPQGYETAPRRARDLTLELRWACYRKCGAAKSVMGFDAGLLAEAAGDAP